ncbi:MAG: GNAT family N-acetyltransferase [Lachnospiraceae bacterium]|nr:GNAT family N-acetyltransferase [Lachnospiraceae bacterium]
MIYKATKEDATRLAQMAILMWDENTVEGLAEEFEEILASDESAIYIYMIENQPIGFAQCQLRHDYVEGTDSSPVGYLEGIFIRDGYRKQGYARELLARCEEWAKEMGCTEFASDCELTNTGSLAFHLNMGFEEANRIICFTKRL